VAACGSFGCRVLGDPSIGTGEDRTVMVDVVSPGAFAFFSFFFSLSI
jgi:hypothetical protein